MPKKKKTLDCPSCWNRRTVYKLIVLELEDTPGAFERSVDGALMALQAYAESGFSAATVAFPAQSFGPEEWPMLSRAIEEAQEHRNRRVNPEEVVLSY